MYILHQLFHMKKNKILTYRIFKYYNKYIYLPTSIAIMS